MDRVGMVQECDQQLRELLPELPRPEQKALAVLVSGVVLAGTVVLGRAAAAAPGPARDASKERRAQRLLANERLDVARAQRRLVARVLRNRRGRVDLLLDATTTGATAGQPGTQTLVLAVAWHRRALPLVWRSWAADAPGQGWAAAIVQMLAAVQAVLAPGAHAVVLADRGLSGGPLACAARAAGCSFVLRVQRTTHVRGPDGAVRAVGELAPAPGTATCLAGAAAWAPEQHHGRGSRRWAAGVPVNAVAVWRPGDPEPWLLLTDLPPTRARCAEYRRRTWEELLFRDLKSLGWQWQRSRVRDSARVERLLLVLALATLWIACLAQRVLRRGWRPLLEPRSRRRYSVFQLGLRWLHRQTANNQHVPCRLRLWTESTTPLKTVVQ